MNYEALLNAFVTLFVTIDPIGNVPLFLAVTTGLSTADRRSVALRSVAIAFVVLGVFAITGTKILDGMGITVHAFRVAGGLLLFYTAFEMIYEKRQERREEVSKTAMKSQIANLAVFPLAFPLLAGPGTISATVLLASQYTTDDGIGFWTGIPQLLLVITLILAITAIMFLLAEYIDKYLGYTGKMVLTRLLGVLLAALSVQYVADGAIALFGS